MQLQIFKPLWGHRGSLQDAICQCLEAGFDGLEGQSPATCEGQRELRARLDEHGLDFIAEIVTARDASGDGYLPRRDATLEEHLSDVRNGLERARDSNALFVTSMAGCDAWSVAQSVEFFGRADEMAREHEVTASWEIHRGRSMFNPWRTREIVEQLPELRLTCDFSHWCVVCERLIDSEADVLELCAQRAHHIHARVGYAQGPQVSDPRAPEYRAELEAHERWWTMIWDAQAQAGRALTTMTPEFGPDGYLHELPYTRAPVADLWDVNRWMGQRQRQRWNEWMNSA